MNVIISCQYTGTHASFFLISQFFARSIKQLSCCCGGTWVPFEHGWSYRKNPNACKFVLSYRFIHKNFRLVRCPVFCPVSGFWTSRCDTNLKIGWIMQCSMRNSKMEFANHFSNVHAIAFLQFSTNESNITRNES